ncbi:hypothetical protein [Winogradskyella aurantiaca]|uniref:hypothetical protein n=1 Tax=Winogradskyella aurantiaca TaxID=2219558 RepID=UPI0013001E6A|nr:hypothetical protein [Winogradskyella aurantiaca]
MAVLVVILGNSICILLGKPNYPFYDVGMFRWSSPFINKPKTVYFPKYYYWLNNEPKILELRKEGTFFMAEHFGLGYTHEYTFATTFHNKSQRENFEFLLEHLQDDGIDTLWVGIHAVNYETKEVWFDPDICKAIEINIQKQIHYGPIFIPEYQLKECYAD